MPQGKDILKRILQTALLAQSGQAGNLLQGQQEAQARLQQIEAERRLRTALEELRQRSLGERQTQKLEFKEREATAKEKAESKKQRRDFRFDKRLERIKGRQRRGTEAFKSARRKEIEGIKGEERRKVERVKGEERRRTKAIGAPAEESVIFPTLDRFRRDINTEAERVRDERTQGAFGEPVTPEDRREAIGRVVKQITGIDISQVEFTNEVDLYRSLLEMQKRDAAPPASGGQISLSEAAQAAIAKARQQAGIE